MSIYRQLWLAIIGMTIISFTGSFTVSVFTARQYIEQQLYMKNADNASSLALVLSQLPSKDPVTVELVISAQFDTGHYQEIVLTDPKHHVIVEKHYTGDESGAPLWFEQLFPLQADAGIALVQDGWKQYGSIRVVSHSRFAYQALWTGIKELVYWFILAGIFAGILGTLLLRLLFQPLNRVVEQAQAIQERRFVTVPEPATLELRSVVVAMNTMVERLKNMFSEEASRLDNLHRQANHDQMTNLPNRDYFNTRLHEALQGDEALSDGSLALIRITDLDALNNRFGRARTDQLIKALADVLNDFSGMCENCMAARLGGADFVLLSPGESDAEMFAKNIAKRIIQSAQSEWGELEDIFHMGTVHYQKNEGASELLASADKALAIAENMGANSYHSLNNALSGNQTMNNEDWRKALIQALSDGRIRLERYPVLASGGQAIHQEGAARLQLQPDGPWLTAGEFMPMALRLKLSFAIDMDALQIALDLLANESTEIAVNLSADSITDWGFRDAMVELLKQTPERSQRLWVEVPEYGAFRNFEAFRSFCLSLSTSGCKLGIEHFGQHLGDIAKLAELGLDYLKIDSRYIRDIAQHTGNQEFLRGLCKISHNVGMLVIAEGVMTEEELTTLINLGFDGVTGQAVTQRTQA